MKIGKLLAIGCACLALAMPPRFDAYAGNDGLEMDAVQIDSQEELEELEAYMRHLLGQKIKLDANGGMPKASESVVMSKAEYLRDRNGKGSRGARPAGKKTKETPKEDAAPSKTLSGFRLEDAQKVYRYSDGLMGKLREGMPLADEGFTWQIPIVNALGENGTIYLEKSKATGELITASAEFALDGRELFLRSGEIAELASGATGGAGIRGIYFIDMPIGAMGRVVAAVALDSGGVVFATVQDVPYYNGMEFRQVYTFDELMGYLEVFEKQAEGWRHVSPLL